MRNAVEAMAASERCDLEVKTSLFDDATIEISVADSGPGLSPEVANHLFEPFISTKRHGMGLGLSICRSIVEANGGELRIRPNPSGGAIFCFTLAAVPLEDGSGPSMWSTMMGRFADHSTTAGLGRPPCNLLRNVVCVS
jgi:two-component system, LuxR family, sensor kinase FixL